MKKYIFIALKYFLPLLAFFIIETMTHGNELVALAFIALYAVYLFLSSKHTKPELALFLTAGTLGALIEIGMTQFSRAQLWQDTAFFAIPLWLPLAWAVAGVVFYRFGKEFE